jgi:hypothetical protein
MFARALSLVALSGVALSGCATGWIMTQAVGGQRALDEGSHDVHVPQPGIEEHLTVSMAPMADSLTCQVAQGGHDIVYHQAFRYGSRWKKTTAIAFLVEGALGAVLLLTASDKEPNNYLYGGFLALDAVVTAPLFFIPRKEIYRHDDVYVTTPVRTDCPEGLALEIDGNAYPIDAAGRVGELGTAALAEWAKTRASSLRVTLGGQERDLVAGAATIPVAPGALTSLAP